jgi:hypothetical protein
MIAKVKQLEKSKNHTNYTMKWGKKKEEFFFIP